MHPSCGLCLPGIYALSLPSPHRPKVSFQSWAVSALHPALGSDDLNARLGIKAMGRSEV